MGWANGSGLFVRVWSLLRQHVPEQNRLHVFEDLVAEFELYDCDTICEVADQWPEGVEWLESQIDDD